MGNALKNNLENQFERKRNNSMKTSSGNMFQQTRLETCFGRTWNKLFRNTLEPILENALT